MRIQKNNSMQPVRIGALSGALAGVLVAATLFVDYGPGAQLKVVARWFGLDFGGIGLLTGSLLMIALGAAFGALFGLYQRTATFNPTRAIIAGLITGGVWFIVVAVLFGALIRGVALSPYSALLFLILALLYGAVLGNLFVVFRERAER